MSMPSFVHDGFQPIWCRLSRAVQWLMACALCLLHTVVLHAQFYSVTQNKTVKITGYFGDGGDLTIPDTLGGLPVVSLGDFSFASYPGLTSVTIPDSVTNIGSYVFYGCSSLTSLTIPDSVLSIGSQAFESCFGLTNLTIGNGVTNIGVYAFYSCSNLTRVTIPDSVLSIGNGAFASCAVLTNVTLGNGLTTIGADAFISCSGLASVWIPRRVTSLDATAFYLCTGLKAIGVDAANLVFSSVDGILFNKGQTELLLYPVARVGASYSIPNGVTNIGDFAFAVCTGLSSVTIPNSVERIGNQAFQYCSGLQSVTLGDGVTSIGYAAFESCGLINLTISTGLSDLGESAFASCSSLTSLTLPNGLTNIGKYAFLGCSELTSLTIPKSVISIGRLAFAVCPALASVTFEGNPPPEPVDPFTGSFPTVYYLPGNTGWRATYGGRPTLLWNPSASPSDPGFWMKMGAFGLNITGTPGITVIVEATANLASGPWIPVSTNQLASGFSLFTDSPGRNGSGTFYRFRTP